MRESLTRISIKYCKVALQEYFDIHVRLLARDFRKEGLEGFSVMCVAESIVLLMFDDDNIRSEYLTTNSLSKCWRTSDHGTRKCKFQIDEEIIGLVNRDEVDHCSFFDFTEAFGLHVGGNELDLGSIVPEGVVVSEGVAGPITSGPICDLLRQIDMKLLSWNVCGLGASPKPCSIQQVMRQQRCHMAVLLETKLEIFLIVAESSTHTGYGGEVEKCRRNRGAKSDCVKDEEDEICIDIMEPKFFCTPLISAGPKLSLAAPSILNFRTSISGRNHKLEESSERTRDIDFKASLLSMMVESEGNKGAHLACPIYTPLAKTTETFDRPLWAHY
ncbi:hypothetical protein V6N11_035262 [Hibiscus sabdariffa]|uniref:Uncharacterized protein n=1 Tax=Hibiscus sabdariffa TaxID=183260 RepID=A0ABR2R0K5_9ROSI